MILQEPTQGVDIGVRFEIDEQIAALSRAGLAVLLISSDVNEVSGLAQRVRVMRRGRLVAELDGEPGHAEEVLRCASDA